MADNNTEITQNAEVKPKGNGRKIFILSVVLVLLILLIFSASYYYFLYLKKQPVSPEPEPQVNDKLFTEEFLEKLGHPEQYYYLNGVVKEINSTDKIIYMDSTFSGAFMTSAPQPSEPYKVHVLVKEDTEISKITIFINQSEKENNSIPKSETTQLTFEDIKVGDNISASFLPEEGDKLDNFEAKRIQIQEILGQ